MKQTKAIIALKNNKIDEYHAARLFSELRSDWKFNLLRLEYSGNSILWYVQVPNKYNRLAIIIAIKAIFKNLKGIINL
jgi:ribosome-associated toxin RatA of RatAB toxin-antitoxin module